MIAAVPEKIAPITKYGPKIVLCQPGRSVMPKTHETTVCTEIATGMMMTAIAPSARARQAAVLGRLAIAEREDFVEADQPRRAAARPRATWRGSACRGSSPRTDRGSCRSGTWSPTRGPRGSATGTGRGRSGSARGRGDPCRSSPCSRRRGARCTVIASAMRVIGRRHPASVTRRIAEISVPAWLMPMKNTKFVM